MKILFLFVAIFALVSQAFAAPLIFKTTKEIDSFETVTLATIDTAKYKQVRIAIKFTKSENTTENEEILIFRKRLEEGEISRLDYDTNIKRINERISRDSVSVFGIEEAQEFYLGGGFSSFVIDVPPSKILVRVSGKGKYLLYVWAQ